MLKICLFLILSCSCYSNQSLASYRQNLIQGHFLKAAESEDPILKKAAQALKAFRHPEQSARFSSALQEPISTSPAELQQLGEDLKSILFTFDGQSSDGLLAQFEKARRASSDLVEWQALLTACEAIVKARIAILMLKPQNYEAALEDFLKASGVLIAENQSPFILFPLFSLFPEATELSWDFSRLELEIRRLELLASEPSCPPGLKAFWQERLASHLKDKQEELKLLNQILANPEAPTGLKTRIQFRLFLESPPDITASAIEDELLVFFEAFGQVRNEAELPPESRLYRAQIYFQLSQKLRSSELFEKAFLLQHPIEENALQFPSLKALYSELRMQLLAHMGKVAESRKISVALVKSLDEEIRSRIPLGARSLAAAAVFAIHARDPQRADIFLRSLISGVKTLKGAEADYLKAAEIRFNSLMANHHYKKASLLLTELEDQVCSSESYTQEDCARQRARVLNQDEMFLTQERLDSLKRQARRILKWPEKGINGETLFAIVEACKTQCSPAEQENWQNLFINWLETASKAPPIKRIEGMTRLWLHIMDQKESGPKRRLYEMALKLKGEGVQEPLLEDLIFNLETLFQSTVQAAPPLQDLLARLPESRISLALLQPISWFTEMQWKFAQMRERAINASFIHEDLFKDQSPVELSLLENEFNTLLHGQMLLKNPPRFHMAEEPRSILNSRFFLEDASPDAMPNLESILAQVSAIPMSEVRDFHNWDIREEPQRERIWLKTVVPGVHHPHPVKIRPMGMAPCPSGSGECLRLEISGFKLMPLPSDLVEKQALMIFLRHSKIISRLQGEALYNPSLKLVEKLEYHTRMSTVSLMGMHPVLLPARFKTMASLEYAHQKPESLPASGFEFVKADDYTFDSLMSELLPQPTLDGVLSERAFEHF